MFIRIRIKRKPRRISTDLYYDIIKIMIFLFFVVVIVAVDAVAILKMKEN